MIYITLSLFLIAALLGATLLFYVLTNKDTPKGLAIIHGTFAALGILFLIALIMILPVKPYLSLGLFILAAIGGFILIYRDLTGKSLPKWLAFGHGITAIIAFVTLVIYLFGYLVSTVV